MKQTVLFNSNVVKNTCKKLVTLSIFKILNTNQTLYTIGKKCFSCLNWNLLFVTCILFFFLSSVVIFLFDIGFNICMNTSHLQIDVYLLVILGRGKRGGDESVLRKPQNSSQRTAALAQLHSMILDHKLAQGDLRSSWFLDMLLRLLCVESWLLFAFSLNNLLLLES